MKCDVWSNQFKFKNILYIVIINRPTFLFVCKLMQSNIQYPYITTTEYLNQFPEKLRNALSLVRFGFLREFFVDYLHVMKLNILLS